ncbi:DegT/DnrJ/EryC1/StrS family aminotransferase [Actinoplanes derwentensis]|uniref:dTDP-4-amino-4,6-dideoxygalactose transaminase n=1 Tax=Actinoplanes derwentensis TaxID=113562 RepID=A0A1H2DDU0_9ACTN|nr:DegT/DnrJ/EryC1/StrS family aminotransferase [Actinoplanes derwentensis]GID90130.1 glutamine--scyllo-inositol aminotransferase [Actinoplanes derwentensis]SDT80754.1 dTDP-4-amino-4,6-dideoxygalactose transaminase [Actinoplanes derwentensis]
MPTDGGDRPLRYEPLRGLALWGTEEEAAVSAVVRARSPFRYYGPDLLGRAQAFEEAFAERIGTPYAVGVSSGTAALACGLVGLGLPAGAEVIVPAVTFVGCPNAVSWARGVPVFAEVDDTLTLDPASLEERLTDRTYAIMPVHLANVAADMEPIMDFARRHGLRVLEDAAQAAGVRYRGRSAGAWGDAGAFSFQLEKNITAGEGGAVTTADPVVHDRVLRYQDQGGQFSTSSGQVRGEGASEPFLGVNLRMTELEGALLGVQLTRLDTMLDRLRSIARHVRAELSGTVEHWRRIPDDEGSGGDVTLFLPSRTDARRLLRLLADAGVPAATLYQGQGVYSNAAVRDGRTAWGVEWSRPARCQRSEQFAGRSVTVTLGATMTDADVDWLVATLRKSYEECRAGGR